MDYYHVFQPYPPPFRKIYARFNGDNHSGPQFPAALCTQPWIFMHLQPDTMAEGMTEIAAVTGLPYHPAGSHVNLAADNPVPYGLQGGLLRPADNPQPV